MLCKVIKIIDYNNKIRVWDNICDLANLLYRPPPITPPYGPCELTDQVPSWRLAEFSEPVGS